MNYLFATKTLLSKWTLLGNWLIKKIIFDLQDYLLPWLKQESERIEHDEALIERYQSETEAVQQKIHDLQTK